MALGQERGHLEPDGEIGRLAIACLGLAEVGGGAARVDVAEETKRPASA